MQDPKLKNTSLDPAKSSIENTVDQQQRRNFKSKDITISSEKDIHEFLYEQGYSDGLPCIPPTPKRVTLMLSGTPSNYEKSDHVIGKCPPNYGEVTIEKVAINAVMAGCKPSQFRIVLAAVECMLTPEFNLHGTHATTMGATPAVIVNGPVRHEAEVNFKHGVLGSGHRANATIGRALKLVLQNVGGAKLGGTESTTLGTPMKYTMCLAEWEERNQWKPYHVTRGFQKEESVVTVMGVTSGPHQVVDFYTKDSNELIQLIAECMHPAYNPYFPFINDCLLVISPEHYDTLMRGGIKSKKQLREKLWAKCNKDMAPSIRKIVASRLPYVGHIVGGALGMLSRTSNLILGTGLPSIPKFSSPDSFHVVVAGGPAGKFSSFAPGFGIGIEGMPTYKMNSPVSRKVHDAPSGMDQQYEIKESTEIIKILDPTGENDSKIFVLAPRVGEIKGNIGLLDISKPGGNKLLDRLAERLEEKYPDVKCHRYCKPTFTRPAPDTLRAMILQQCQSVIIALAD